MAHFVQYHNTDKMGYPCYSLSGNEFWVSTRKFVSDSLFGNHIWLIGGEGKPRSYSLCETFMVTGVDISENPDFRFRIWGDKGVRIRPAINITHYHWFRELQGDLGNFRFGLTAISETYADLLDQIAMNESEKYKEARESGWLKGI